MHGVERQQMLWRRLQEPREKGSKAWDLVLAIVVMAFVIAAGFALVQLCRTPQTPPELQQLQRSR